MKPPPGDDRGEWFPRGWRFAGVALVCLVALVVSGCSKATPKADPELPQVAGIWEGTLASVSDDSTRSIPTRDASVTVTQSEADVEIMVKSSYDDMDDDGTPIRVTQTHETIKGTIGMDGVVALTEPAALGFSRHCGPDTPVSSSATFKDGVLRVEAVATTELCGEVTDTLEAEHKLRPV